MKVAINARFILPRLEGIGHYTHEIIKQLASNHPDDEFHVILDRKVYKAFMDLPNIVVHVLSPPARHPFLWYTWYEIRIPKLLREISADVFFSPDGYGSLSTTVPTILTIHDLAYRDFPEGSKWIHRKYLERFMPRYVRDAQTIIAVSEFTARRIAAFFPEVTNKVTTVPNGLTNGFQPVSPERQQAIREQVTGGRPFFLYLGAIHPRKNVARLIKAFSTYKTKTGDDVCLVLAGRFGWQTKSVEEQLKNGKHANDIIHITHFEDQICDLVASATALCYLSLLEGFGLPVLEAMACGTPVITSRDSAMTEIGGDAVLYADPTDIRDIAAKMNLVRTNHVSVQEGCTKGLIRAQHYSWRSTAEKIYDLLQKNCINSA